MTLRHLRPLTLLLGLLLASCTFQYTTTVTPTGAGDLRSEVGVSQADEEMLTTLETTPETMCTDAQLDGNLPDGGTLIVEERGDETWCVVTVPFATLEELRVAYEELDVVTINVLELTPGGFSYDVDVDTTGSDDLGEGVEVIYKWSVTPPGTITDHNADEVDGNTLTWNLALGEVVNARVVTTISPFDALTGAGGLPGWVIPSVIGLCCCLLLLVAVVVVVVVVMRRRQAGNPVPPPAL